MEIVGLSGCEQTEELISDITNELMLQIGSKNTEDHPQILQQFNKLTEIKDRLNQWKFGILSDHQNTLQYQVQTKRRQIQSLLKTMNQHRQQNTQQLQQLKKLIYNQTKQSLYKKQTEELKKNYEYLNTVLEKLKSIKKEVETYHSNLLKSDEMKKKFQSGLSDVYKVGQRLTRDLNIRSEKITQENQIIQKKIKQVRQQIKVQQSKRIQSQVNLKLSRHNSKVIQKEMDYKVLEIQASNKKLGESDPEEIVYKSLQPKYRYNNEIGIYISSIVLILLIHYVVY